MTATTMPKRISESWVKQQETYLRSTVKEIAGEPNPAYLQLQAEIDDAKAQQAAWEAFAAWVADQFGLRTLNQYDLRVSGVVHKPFSVFCRKDRTTGRVEFRTVASCWELYQAAN